MTTGRLLRYTIETMNDVPFALPEFAPGSVWLIGAGPGDPGLLTLLALHAIRCADAVIYDALVDPRILQAAKPGAEIVFAGKRGGRPSQQQPDITATAIALAKAGKRVARLKGGDPFVFGRGGEEAQGFVAAGVPFRVVPGITAGIGGLAYAGIPLTHRGAAGTIAFVTGHQAAADPDDGAGVDWPALASACEVLVVYMPLGRLAVIVATLIEAGRSPEEPAALVSKATTPEQIVIETTLADANEAAMRAEISTPALFVVGPVVALRRTLAWYDDAEAGAAPQAVPRKAGAIDQDTSR